MSKGHIINRAVRYALMAGTAVAVAGYVPTAPAANANTPAHLGKVTVTGSRIKRTDVETAQPITRISRQQIQRSGYTNIGDLLQNLPSAGATSNSANQSLLTTINLRNLGANRNLVLVNGKRWFQELNGSTNLNTIPTSIIDHIEILQDGASAVYGSDAISGVVNIITVKNYKGAEIHAYYGIHNDPTTGSWDGQINQDDITIGTGNDRGNVVFNLTYKKVNPIYLSARTLTRTQVAGQPGYVNGTDATPSGRFRLFGPAVSGRTIGQATCGTYDPNQPLNTLCDLTLQNTPAQPSLQNFRSFRNTDRVSTVGYNNLQTKQRDVTAYIQGHYNLFNSVTVTANAAFVRDYQFRHYAPVTLDAGAQSTHRINNTTHYGIAMSNPYNPFGVDLAGNSNAPCIAAGTCIGLNQVSRLPVEGGPIQWRRNNTDFHAFVGFNGFVNLFQREIDWNVGFTQNSLQYGRVAYGYHNVNHTAEALGQVSQCVNMCVPLNLFGGAGTITPDQYHYPLYESDTLTQSNVRDWTANLSSDVYDLPAGPLGVAIGWERIENYGKFRPDSVEVAGNSTGSALIARNGDLIREAEYAELNIPLLADLPGAENLSVDIANRWTQFTRSGGQIRRNNATTFVHNSSGRLNLRWQVINDLLLRASWSQGFRSPTINELFHGIHDADFAITDPCVAGQYGGYNGGPLPPNCPNGTLITQPNTTVTGFTGSNPNLQPEKSISRTFGFVYSPSQVPGLDINADYYKIEINNAVGTIGAQTIVNGCFYDATFCSNITYTGNQIGEIYNLNTNVGSLLTEGVDVGLHYKFPSTPIGDFDARINGTFLRTFDQTKPNLATATGFATSHLAGVDPREKRRFNGYLDWDYGNWSAQYHIQYIGSAVDVCSVSVEGYCSLPNKTANYQGTPGLNPLGRQHLGTTVYHDVHVGYTVPSINTTFGLGVQNLFDKKPPITGSGGFNFGVYRRPSRFIYGSIRVKF